MSNTPSDRWRTKKEIQSDLAKAFSTAESSLDLNRTGRLASDQVARFTWQALKPLALAGGGLAIPVLAFSFLGSSLEGGGGLFGLIAQLKQPQQLWEALGWFRCALLAGSLLAGLGVAFVFAMRFSPAFYFDCLDRAVLSVEGRVEGQEQTTIRANGKDPIETFFFHHKSLSFQVSREAYYALDPGAFYSIYMLPRSRKLVALQPKFSEQDKMAS